MKSRLSKILFAGVAFAFALGLFIYSVLATIKISANLSGSFSFYPPPEHFNFLVEARMTGHRGEDVFYKHRFDNENENFPWQLNDKIHFDQTSDGDLKDIVFEFYVENLNEVVEGRGRVHVSYEILDYTDTSFISLEPSQNLKDGFTLEARAQVDEETGEIPPTNNSAKFTVTLSSIATRPEKNFDASFDFQINLNFI